MKKTLETARVMTKKDCLYSTAGIIEILENDPLYWAIHVGRYTTTTYAYVEGNNLYLNGLYPINENNEIYECKSETPLPINFNTLNWEWKLIPREERCLYEFDE